MKVLLTFKKPDDKEFVPDMWTVERYLTDIVHNPEWKLREIESSAIEWRRTTDGYRARYYQLI
jgi:hypothetical protein